MILLHIPLYIKYTSMYTYIIGIVASYNDGDRVLQIIILQQYFNPNKIICIFDKLTNINSLYIFCILNNFYYVAFDTLTNL